MKIVSVKDKRVKALIEDRAAKSVKGLDKQQTQKIAEMLTAIEAMTNPLQLVTVPGWNAHELKPAKPGVWSLKVTGNYRLTFRVDQDAEEVSEVDYLDYH